MRKLKGLEYTIQLRENTISEKMCVIKISHMNYISKIFIPFLDNLTFFSKKENSYKDWKSIALIKLSGKHLTPEGRILCESLSSRMIDRTYFSVKDVPVTDALGLKVQNRLAIEQLDLQVKQILEDTSILINKIRGGYVKVQIFDHLTKPFSSTMSLQEVADFFQVSKKTISRRLVDGMPLLHNNSKFYVKKKLIKLLR